jgi:ligand-binding sensor domain-containing protein/two-component sensor histidine kinase
MIKWVIIIGWLLIPFCAAAQPAPFSFRTISINDGLSQSSVVDMATDEIGFLWMATQDGLNRYDGKEFVVFKKNFDDITTPVNSKLGKIVHGLAHELWLITSGGRVERLNLYNQVFTPLTSVTRDSLPLPPVSCLWHDQQRLWIGTERQGVFLYQPNGGETIHYTARHSSPVVLTSDTIQNIFIDQQRQAWILTNNGITAIAANRLKAGYFLTRSTDRISCSTIDEDVDHTLWLGTYGKGVYLKRKTDTAFTSFTGFTKKDTLPADLVVQSIKTDKLGRIWIGTYGKGLFVVNVKNNTVQQVVNNKRNPFSLSYNDVLCIKEDKSGGIWIGTDGGGVTHYDKRLNNFTLLAKTNVPEQNSIEQVRCITTDSKGSIWIGTSSSGLTMTDARQSAWQTFHLPAFRKNIDNPERIVSLLTDANDDIWIGSQGNGLLIMDAGTRKIKKAFHPGAKEQSVIPDYTIWCMLPDTGTRVWAGTRNAGLLLVDKQKGLLKQFNASGRVNKLAENNIRTLTAVNDSIICLGFEKKGIQLLNTRTGQVISIPGKLSRLFTHEETILKCVFLHAPYLWIGTLGKGLIAVNLKTYAIHSITEKQGLPNNTVYGLLKDQSGAFWMSTNKGINRFIPPADLSTVNRSHFSSYTVADGLQSNEFNTGAYHQAKDGTLFFGGTHGLNMFHPVRISRVEQPAMVAITRATVNNEPLQSDTSIFYKKVLSLPYSENSLSFNFAALDFVSPGRFNYSYLLDGYDAGWIDAGNRNYAAYTKLPPGHYTFSVKASRQPFGGNNPVTTLSIIIRPPFWRTGWFIAGCVLLLTGLLYAFYRYRISQLIRVQKIRNRIATDLHDDIGSTLTNISILSELSRQHLPPQQEAHVFLNRISEEVNNSSQALDDIIWSINTNNDTLEQTVARMRRYAAEVFDAANITYSLQLDEQFAGRKLNMEQRRDWFLIFKEAINNIYKHAKAKQVTIRIWIEKNRLCMTIRDDGTGFNTSLVTHRNGIKNMHQRVDKWQGRIDIQSVPGQGTFTSLELPV